MDQFMNTHQYPLNLLKDHLLICTYNALKEEKIVGKMFGKEYDRTEYLVNDYPTATILSSTELFLDEDGQMKQLPAYVVKQIKEAIGSVNIYPNHLCMSTSVDNYILSADYTNEGMPDYKKKPTIVQLEYTFGKNMREFEGYFAERIENECWLPDYEIAISKNPHDAHYKEVSISVSYKNNSSLKVNIKHRIVGNGAKITDFVSFSSLPDYLKNCKVNYSLLDCVLHRIFPTKAHLYKFLWNQRFTRSELNFHKNMTLTAANDLKYLCNDEFLHCCSNYILKCHQTNKTQPIDTALSVGEKTEAMQILGKYPFFIFSAESSIDFCVYDEWIRYFKKDLTTEDAEQMQLSADIEANLMKFGCSNPVKYSRIFELFPKVTSRISLDDFGKRLDLLKKMRRNGDAMLESLDVVYFNRLKSAVPVRWRLFLWRGTLNKPVYEVGNDIIKMMENRVPPANSIEEINYLDVENADHPLSLAELMSQSQLLVMDHFETLDPKNLEVKFQSYRFSDNYKTKPTERDNLAVRFVNVYKKDGYQVPEIPADFYDRLDNCEESEQDDKFNCVICTKRVKNHVFPVCKHMCVCELCSYQLLKCPICYKAGNPQKLFL